MYEQLPEGPSITPPFIPPGSEGEWIDPLGVGTQLTVGTGIMPDTWGKVQRWLAEHQNLVLGAVGVFVLLTVVDGRRR